MVAAVAPLGPIKGQLIAEGESKGIEIPVICPHKGVILLPVRVIGFLAFGAQGANEPLRQDSDQGV